MSVRESRSPALAHLNERAQFSVGFASPHLVRVWQSLLQERLFALHFPCFSGASEPPPQ